MLQHWMSNIEEAVSHEFPKRDIAIGYSLRTIRDKFGWPQVNAAIDKFRLERWGYRIIKPFRVWHGRGIGLQATQESRNTKADTNKEVGSRRPARQDS